MYSVSPGRCQLQPSDCLFCRIALGNQEAVTIWSDPHHVAVLTPYPNTPGFTVLFTREHRSSNVFELPVAEFTELMLAGREVSFILAKAFSVDRCAMIVEGMGIDHIKLIPLHGVRPGPWHPINSTVRTYTTTYEGYVSSHDGPLMPIEELQRLREMILKSGEAE